MSADAFHEAGITFGRLCNRDEVLIKRWTLLVAFDGDSLLDLDDFLIEDVGLHDVQIKQLGTGLQANLETIAEPLGDQQCNLFAFPLQQGVGSNRGSHAYAQALEFRRVDGFISSKGSASGLLQNPSDTLNGSVIVVCRVLRQELHNNVIFSPLNSSQAVCKRAASVCLLVSENPLQQGGARLFTNSDSDIKLLRRSLSRVNRYGRHGSER